MSQKSEFESYFSLEEIEILAVTGATGFGGGKSPKDKLWAASIELIAWKEGPGMETGSRLLTMLADDRQLEKLRRQAKANSVIRARVRRSLDGRRYLLTAAPHSAADPELEAYLSEQLKPVFHTDPDLGEFSLERTVNWFEKESLWMGKKMNLYFDRDEPEEMESSLKTAKALLGGMEEWDARIRACAVENLLELKNDSWQDDDDEALTAEQFAALMEPDGLNVMPDGEFDFWFSDGDMFWGHSIRVSGTVQDGPQDATIEG